MVKMVFITLLKCFSVAFKRVGRMFVKSVVCVVSVFCRPYCELLMSFETS